MKGKNVKVVKRSQPFIPGRVLETFDVDKAGRNMRVVFRYPKMSDLHGLMRYINVVVKESEFLRLNEKVTLDEERKWLKTTMDAMRKGRKVYISAEINGVISGAGAVESMAGASSHVGELGISFREKYTGLGIGSRLIELLMNEAMKIGIEVVKLSHYSNNMRAKHVYERMGFVHVGTIPRARKHRNGGYSGETIMYKVLVK